MTYFVDVLPSLLLFFHICFISLSWSILFIISPNKIFSNIKGGGGAMVFVKWDLRGKLIWNLVFGGVKLFGVWGKYLGFGI